MNNKILMKIILVTILINGNNAMSENLNWRHNLDLDTSIKLNSQPTKFVFGTFLEFDLENKTIWIDPDLQPKEIAEKFLESMKYLGFNPIVEK